MSRAGRLANHRAAQPVAFASQLSYDSWIGLRPFDHCLRIAVPQPPPGPSDPWPPWLQRVHERRTQQRISLWDMDGQSATEVRRRIEAFQPAFLFGYTSTLAVLAELLRERNLRLRRPLRGVITTSETLTPPRRRLIEDGFRAPITNRYGLLEFGCFSAQSCAASPERFHVNTELVACEILRQDGSPADEGETGRIALTDLWNDVRPFIRYDTGDLAARMGGACSCGRGIPLLGPIEGRSQECLTTPAGKTINPGLVGHYLFVHHRHGDAVRHYQLVQEGPARVWSEGTAGLLREDLSRLLGPETDVVVQVVAEIAAERSGKRPIVRPAGTGP